MGVSALSLESDVASTVKRLRWQKKRKQLQLKNGSSATFCFSVAAMSSVGNLLIGSGTRCSVFQELTKTKSENSFADSTLLMPTRQY